MKLNDYLYVGGALLGIGIGKYFWDKNHKDDLIMEEKWTQEEMEEIKKACDEIVPNAKIRF